MRNLFRLFVACSVIAPLAAGAATTNGTLALTAKVQASCSVAAAAIDFPIYDPIADSGRTAQTNLSIVCTKNHSATIGLDDGGNFTAATGRAMIGGTGADLLKYELYQDAAMSKRFGSSGIERLGYVGKGKTADTSVVVYAQIVSGQNDTPAGSYADSVVIDIAF